MVRIGIGHDTHKLVPDRKLILGGVHIPFELGLLGHSDADVLTHALMDALLGAAAMGDIGRHFPDTDPAYKGADSLMLLARVVDMLAKEGYQLVNADTIIHAQKPKLAGYISQMEANLATVLQVPPSAVNVKATTGEGLGFIGRMEGISAQAVCLIQNK